MTDRAAGTTLGAMATEPAPRTPGTSPPAERGQPRLARLVDVADRAGVSVKTVSNVVNGYAHVSPGTRAKVDAALVELDYRPNLAARQLRRGRSGILALAVPELEVPYFAELARHVVEAARGRGWTVLIDQTDGELDRELLAMDSFGDPAHRRPHRQPARRRSSRAGRPPGHHADGAARRAGVRRAR